MLRPALHEFMAHLLTISFPNALYQIKVRSKKSKTLNDRVEQALFSVSPRLCGETPFVCRFALFIGGSRP